MGAESRLPSSPEDDDEAASTAGGDAYIIEEIPLYLPLGRVQSILRRDRLSAIIITIGCSIATGYISFRYLWLLICGILMVSLGIAIDYLLVEKEIKKMKEEKKKVRIVPGNPR